MPVNLDRERESERPNEGRSSPGRSRFVEPDGARLASEPPGRRPRRPGGTGSEGIEPKPFVIELTDAQIHSVLGRARGSDSALSVLSRAVRDPNWRAAMDSSFPSHMQDSRLSRSLLSGLIVLTCFSKDEAFMALADVAREIGMNTSTTHRYVTTLLRAGLLEQDAVSRKYRIARAQ